MQGRVTLRMGWVIQKSRVLSSFILWMSKWIIFLFAHWYVRYYCHILNMYISVFSFTNFSLFQSFHSEAFWSSKESNNVIYFEKSTIHFHCWMRSKKYNYVHLHLFWKKSIIGLMEGWPSPLEKVFWKTKILK